MGIDGTEVLNATGNQRLLSEHMTKQCGRHGGGAGYFRASQPTTQHPTLSLRTTWRVGNSQAALNSGT